ncbi:hypothetical protein [Pseudomonas sp. S1(2024)]|uniref:hypothetical protein n=1 Tax=Pseudomonas sp. S1(2024) TaxID=3390191 RepID=UPI00397B5F64
MLQYEFNLLGAHVQLKSEPHLDIENRSFQVNAELLDHPPKWAGYATPVILRGQYDLALLQKLKLGAVLSVKGGYNSAMTLGDYGYINAFAIEAKPAAPKRLAEVVPLSTMSIEQGCESISSASERAATDRFMRWELALNEQDIWLDRVVSRFLCANPEHFEQPLPHEDPLDNPWVKLSYAIHKAEEENPYILGSPWIAPRPMVEALVGKMLCDRLYEQASLNHRTVIEHRPGRALTSLRLNEIDPNCLG